jgi:hypothetical protein
MPPLPANMVLLLRAVKPNERLAGLLTQTCKVFQGWTCSSTWFSDPLHWIKKWSLAFFSLARHMKIGVFDVLHSMLIMCHMQHSTAGLRVRDVNGADRMSAASASHRQNHTVREGLYQAPYNLSDGLLVYLYMGQCFEVAFFDRQLTARQRWQAMCRTAVFVRYWFAWHTAIGHHADHFIPMQLFSDFFINFNSFAYMVLAFRDVYNGQQFCPWLFGSDQNENMFSVFREYKSSFTLKELLGIVRRYHAENSMMCDPDVRKKLPEYVTRHGQHRSVYNVEGETCKKEDFPTDDEMVDIYESEVAAMKPLLEYLGMKDALVNAGHWDMPPLENLKLAADMAAVDEEQDINDPAEDVDPLEEEDFLKGLQLAGDTSSDDFSCGDDGCDDQGDWFDEWPLEDSGVGVY